MSHLLHVDSSLRVEASRSRQMTAFYADLWRKAHPDGEVTYRDVAAAPVPHLTHAAFTANLTPEADRSPEQVAERAITEPIVGELVAATHLIAGVPLYNFGAPSSFKAWFDRLVVPGVTMGVEWTSPEVTIVVSRGGGYDPGTPRHGWDHAEPWVRHAFSAIGIEEINVVHASLTLARESPAMVPLDLGHLEDASLAAALEQLEALV